MHPSALSNAKRFFETYTDSSHPNKVVEIGSQIVNGSIKDVCPPSFDYIGVDFVEGDGVDVVLTDPYALPFESGSMDIVVCSSCLEHSEMFWLVYLEILRILKPHGLFYMNVPSNGFYHRYPVDCWRFYPDSAAALEKWSRRNGLDTICLESYVSDQYHGVWNDYIAVFLKDEKHAQRFTKRIVENFSDFRNGRIMQSMEILQFRPETEDLEKMGVMESAAETRGRPDPA